MIRLLSACVVLSPLLVSAAPKKAPAAKSLCSPEETVVYSCELKNKAKGEMLSLCASKDLSARTGTLQFRMGVPGAAPTAVYPEQAVHPSRAFRYGFGTQHGTDFELLDFKLGGKRHVVYSSSGGGLRMSGLNLGGSKSDPQCKQYKALGLVPENDELPFGVTGIPDDEMFIP
ncbi:MAG: hypothetical protein RL653_3568 [Pseudomonadota bacterium]